MTALNFFFCLSGLAGICRTILKVNGESRSCRLIPDLMGETFSLSQLHVYKIDDVIYKAEMERHRCREQTYGYLRERGDVMNWEIGTDICIVLN